LNFPKYRVQVVQRGRNFAETVVAAYYGKRQVFQGKRKDYRNWLQFPEKTCTCDCGNIINIPKRIDKEECYYDVSNVRCLKCGRESGGGNCETGEIGGWILEPSLREHENPLFNEDTNEWLGRD